MTEFLERDADANLATSGPLFSCPNLNSKQMKIVLYLLTAIIQLAVAVPGFFILLLGLNGFSEREATPSLILYLVVSVVTVFGDGAVGLIVGNWLVRKKNLSAGGFLGNVLAVVLGTVILIVTLFGCFLLASVLHDARKS